MRDLTQGRIIPQLIKLALPIMGTGVAQLAYNFADIFWLGRLSAEAMAAASIAGLVAWFTFSIAMLTKIGAEVCIAQAIGKCKLHAARLLASHAIVISFLISLVPMIALLLFARPLVLLFHLSPAAAEAAIGYINVIALCMPFWFLSPTFAGIYNATGNSRTPFIVSAICIVVNIALDPLLIFGFDMGVFGAALATGVAEILQFVLFVALLRRPSTAPFAGFRFMSRLRPNLSLQLIKVGAPASLQNALHAGISFVISTIAAHVGGHVGVAVHGSGSQIESLSYIAANGVSTALSAYIGQNYGARKMERVKKSFVGGVSVVAAYGALIGVLFMLFGRTIFSIFVPNDATVQVEGASYLFVFGLSQLFMCVEIASTGAFNGLGRSYIPASIGITFNALRIPLALVLSSYWGLVGVWWALCISTIFKGTILVAAFPAMLRRVKRREALM